MFRGAVVPDFIFINNNVKPDRAHIVDDYFFSFEEDDIQCRKGPRDLWTTILLNTVDMAQENPMRSVTTSEELS